VQPRVETVTARLVVVVTLKTKIEIVLTTKNTNKCSDDKSQNTRRNKEKTLIVTEKHSNNTVFSLLVTQVSSLREPGGSSTSLPFVGYVPLRLSIPVPRNSFLDGKVLGSTDAIRDPAFVDHRWVPSHSDVCLKVVPTIPGA